MADTTPTNDEWVNIDLVYVGPCLLSSGKWGHEYRTKDLTREVALAAPVSGRRSDIVGGVYATKYKGNSFSLTGKFIGMHERTDLVAGWKAKALTVEAEKKYEKRLQDGAARENHPLFRGLDPIREAYLSTSHAGRAALLTDIILYITKRG